MNISFHPDVPDAHRQEIAKAASKFFYAGGPPHCDVGEFPRLGRLALAGRTFRPEPARRHRYEFTLDLPRSLVRVRPA